MPRQAGVTRRGALATGVALLAGCATSRSDAGAGGDAAGATADATLGFAGDAMLGRGVDAAQAERPPEALWGDLRPALQALDGVLMNLECTLSTRGEPTPGRTYRFRADPAWAAPALRAGNVAFASLANNHVLDYGPIALDDTLGALDGAGVAHAGAGPDRAAAVAPANVSVGDLDVAVVAATDRAPAYAAGAVAPGTAYLPMAGDPLTRGVLAGAVRAARATDPDLVVASVHWGPNWETAPADRYRDLARWLVDAGVDVVHGHSAHVPQGVEVYRGRPILHDLGDVVDDYAVLEGLHNDRSVLVELAVSGGRPAGLRLRPVHIEDAAVERATGEVAAWIRRTLRARSAALGTDLERDGDALAVDLPPPA